ncbi:hypothetical protein [Celerinatantimonas sp. YJH-8]|uniref:hypothetical protein n=1 Tax=Celerinatantimonas sp. YJH-8 TaxID=3228714 RepID=UPI0038BE786C
MSHVRNTTLIIEHQQWTDADQHHWQQLQNKAKACQIQLDGLWLSSCGLTPLQGSQPTITLSSRSDANGIWHFAIRSALTEQLILISETMTLDDGALWEFIQAPSTASYTLPGDPHHNGPIPRITQSLLQGNYQPILRRYALFRVNRYWLNHSQMQQPALQASNNWYGRLKSGWDYCSTALNHFF